MSPGAGAELEGGSQEGGLSAVTGVDGSCSAPESGRQEWWGAQGICCVVFCLVVVSAWFPETREDLPWPPPTRCGASVLVSGWGSVGL